MVFWFVTPCGDVIGYQRVEGSCCLNLHFGLKVKAARSSEMLVSYYTMSQPRRTWLELWPH